MPDLACVLNKW